MSLVVLLDEQMSIGVILRPALVTLILMELMTNRLNPVELGILNQVVSMACRDLYLEKGLKQLMKYISGYKLD